MLGEDIYREVARDFPGYTYKDIKKVIDIYFDDVLQATLAQKAVFTKFGQIGYLHINSKTLNRYFEILKVRFSGSDEKKRREYFKRIVALKDPFEKKIQMYVDLLHYKEGYYSYITDRIQRSIDHLTRRLNRIKKFEDEFRRYATEDMG